jgi:hypothetical protein
MPGASPLPPCDDCFAIRSYGLFRSAFLWYFVPAGQLDLSLGHVASDLHAQEQEEARRP